MKGSKPSTLLCRVSLCLLGVAAVWLPWFQLSILGGTAAIYGYDVWQGKVGLACLGVFGATLLGSLVYSPLRPWQSTLSGVTGVALLALCGWYLFELIRPAPTQIDVQHGGDLARLFTRHLVKSMHGRLGFGAPLGVLAGLGLVLTVSLRSRGRA